VVTESVERDGTHVRHFLSKARRPTRRRASLRSTAARGFYFLGSPNWPSDGRRSALTEERDTLLPMVADHEVLTLKEVSQILQVHPITLYKMVRAGKIPSFRIGTDWRFRKDLLIRWMADQTVG
jgi:excisionase family DNA binding protein